MHLAFPAQRVHREIHFAPPPLRWPPTRVSAPIRLALAALASPVTFGLRRSRASARHPRWTLVKKVRVVPRSASRYTDAKWRRHRQRFAYLACCPADDASASSKRALAASRAIASLSHAAHRTDWRRGGRGLLRVDAPFLPRRRIRRTAKRSSSVAMAGVNGGRRRCRMRSAISAACSAAARVTPVSPTAAAAITCSAHEGSASQADWPACSAGRSACSQRRRTALTLAHIKHTSSLSTTLRPLEPGKSRTPNSLDALSSTVAPASPATLFSRPRRSLSLASVAVHACVSRSCKRSRVSR